jgi:hypothetical protein
VSIDARLAKAERELAVARADSKTSLRRKVLSRIAEPLGFYVLSKTEFWASEHLADFRHEKIMALLASSPPSTPTEKGE